MDGLVAYQSESDSDDDAKPMARMTLPQRAVPGLAAAAGPLAPPIAPAASPSASASPAPEEASEDEPAPAQAPQRHSVLAATGLLPPEPAGRPSKELQVRRCALRGCSQKTHACARFT